MITNQKITHLTIPSHEGWGKQLTGLRRACWLLGPCIDLVRSPGFLRYFDTKLWKRGEMVMHFIRRESYTLIHLQLFPFAAQTAVWRGDCILLIL